jgi:terminase small subunit-like protein
MPSLNTPELQEELLDWIASGQTLRAFCRQPNKPAWRTVYTWLEADADFAARIARARDLGADAIAEEALSIADTPLEGVVTTTDEDGTKTVTEDMLGHRKLQVETRLKLLAKWNPKKYGDKIDHTLTGKNGGPIVLTNTDADL